MCTTWTLPEKQNKDVCSSSHVTRILLFSSDLAQSEPDRVDAVVPAQICKTNED